MREIKAGLGLVFGNRGGKIYFVLFLIIWICSMIGAPVNDMRDTQSSTSFLLFWLLPAICGASFLGMCYVEVINCGGLYCVPNLIKGLARFSIMSAFIVAFMCSLFFLAAEGLSYADRFIYMLISFPLVMPIFLTASVPLQFKSKYPFQSLIRILWLVYFVGLGCACHLGLQFVKNWVVTIAVGILLSIIYCRSYTDRLKIAQRQVLSSADSKGQEGKKKGLISPAVEQFFINRLTYCSNNRKYLWGAIYLCLGSCLSCMKYYFLVPLAITLFTCFFETASSFLVIIMMTMMLFMQDEMNIKSPAHSSMLMSGGRNQRFYGTIASAVSALIFFELMFVLFLVISWLIAPFIPPVVFRGQEFTFTPLPIYSPFILFIFIPLIFSFAICSEKVRAIMKVIGFLFPIIFLGILIIIRGKAILLFIPIALIVFSWVFFVLAAWIICYKKDLILQTDKI